MMTDPMADMLTRIRNANRIERPAVDMPATRLKTKPSPRCSRTRASSSITRSARSQPTKAASDVLSRSADLADAKTVLRVYLKYGPEGERVIRHIERASRPGRRLYRRSRRTAAGAGRPGHHHPQHQPRAS